MLTEAFVRFAHSARTVDFGEEARRLALNSIIDGVGCMYAGAQEATPGIVASIIPLAMSPAGVLQVFSPTLSIYATPADCAWHAATAMDALEFGDVSHPAQAHPITVLLSSLLSASCLSEVSGNELITSYLVGFELLGKLGCYLNPRLFDVGWHPTPVVGPMASVLGGGTLLGLGEEQLLAGLGHAASSAGGIRANLGTMGKPLHAGQAARAGVIFMQLAMEGASSSDRILDHEFGLLRCFGFEGDLDSLTRNLPVPERCCQYGVALKMYPSCIASHPGIEAAMQGAASPDGRRHQREVLDLCKKSNEFESCRAGAACVIEPGQ